MRFHCGIFIKISKEEKLPFDRYSEYSCKSDEGNPDDYDGSCILKMREGKREEANFVVKDEHKPEADNQATESE